MVLVEIENYEFFFCLRNGFFKIKLKNSQDGKEWKEDLRNENVMCCLVLVKEAGKSKLARLADFVCGSVPRPYGYVVTWSYAEVLRIFSFQLLVAHGDG